MLKLRPHHVSRILELEQAGNLYQTFFSAIVRMVYGAKTYKNYRNVTKRISNGEEFSITHDLDAICADCPYQRPCQTRDYKSGREMMPLLIRGFAKLSDTEIADYREMRRLKLEERKAYRIEDFLGSTNYLKSEKEENDN